MVSVVRSWLMVSLALRSSNSFWLLTMKKMQTKNPHTQKCQSLSNRERLSCRRGTCSADRRRPSSAWDRASRTSACLAHGEAERSTLHRHRRSYCSSTRPNSAAAAAAVAFEIVTARNEPDWTNVPQRHITQNEFNKPKRTIDRICRFTWRSSRADEAARVHSRPARCGTRALSKWSSAWAKRKQSGRPRLCHCCCRCHCRCRCLPVLSLIPIRRRRRQLLCSCRHRFSTFSIK